MDIRKKTKWTFAAYQDDKEIATAPSRKKLEAKLEKMFPKEPAPTPTPIAKPGKKNSIRQRVIGLMKDGQENESITAIIKSEFPGTKYDEKHTAWYRSNLIRWEVINREFSAVNMKRKARGEYNG